MNSPTQMTEESIAELLIQAGAKVQTRAGRTEHYSAPREYSFEVKSIFPNGLGMQVIARQYNYVMPWENEAGKDSEGRTNDLVDVFLTRDGRYSELPKGFPFFQDDYSEENIDEKTLIKMINCVATISTDIYRLQQLTGDLPEC